MSSGARTVRPRRTLRTALVLGLALGMPAAAQQIRTYTQSQTGANFLVLGLPVPQPIASLTPVDGFRSYASIDARLQGLAMSSADLSAHDIGRTFAGRPHWAYVVGDEDGVDVEGRPEAAFFINATTHAREWGAPEVSTGTIERLIAGAGDGGLTRYLLDNTRLVIIPVHNIDGLLQTQRYPTDAIVGQDPDVPTIWPRDGRMRRKNMRGVDEVLTTFADHLGGVDLNRNHPPFWATSVGQGGSSANPNSLTYHGSAPHSEPESLALERAAELAPASRIRLGIDVHSFSRLFFSSNTARSRLNDIQARLIGNMAVHHEQVSGKFYVDVPDPPNSGIGTAAEYFAYQWLVPAWTLELEPQNDAREYGGTNVTHSGFILPAGEARRVRESWAETHLVAFYTMAGPPHLARLRVYEVASNSLAFESRWQYDAAIARRTRATPVANALRPGVRYRAEMAFSKPMRRRDANGAEATFPGLFVGTPQAALLRGTARTVLDTAAGTWLNDPARVLRYRDDTFAFEFTAPEAVDSYRFEVAASDLAGFLLDADPSTPADWSAGAWSEWEDSFGVDSDFGGPDASTTLSVASAPTLVELVADPRTMGEGDTVPLRLRRPQPGPERVEVRRYPPNGELSPAPTLVATWLPGESGERSVPIAAGENLTVDGDRTLSVVLGESVDGAERGQLTVQYRILDNDRSEAVVMRLRDANGLAAAWESLRSGTPERHVVLDRQTYAVPQDAGQVPSAGLASVTSSLRVSGNGATLNLTGARRNAPAFDVAAQGRLVLDHVQVSAHAPQQVPLTALLRNAGELTLARAEVAGDALIGSDLIESSGTLRIARARIHDVRTDPHSAIRVTGGSAQIEASTIDGNQGMFLAWLNAGALRLHATTWIGNSSGATPFERSNTATGPEFAHTLIQDNTDSTALSPPIGENCGAPAQSLGFNIENHTRCGFNASGDHSDVDLGDFPFSAALGGYAPIGAAIEGGVAATQAPTSACGAVDQRGVPRPQTLTSGAQPRCDIGAIELGINPYRGIWQPERDGHGVEIHTAGNQLLIVWYSYGDDGQPTMYQATGALTGTHWEADLLQARRNPQTGAVTVPKVGRVSLDFTNDTDARLGWRFDARGINGSERIRPATFATGEPRFEVSGVWYPPAESGSGATITRRGEITAIVFYYYDAAGNIRWQLGAGNAADAVEIPMRSYTGFCPDCSNVTMPVTSVPAGTLLAHFLTPDRARFDVQLTYPGAAGGAWNRERQSFVPLNDPVDNRYPLDVGDTTR